jgi:heat shock protein HslJ
MKLFRIVLHGEIFGAATRSMTSSHDGYGKNVLLAYALIVLQCFVDMAESRQYLPEKMALQCKLLAKVTCRGQPPEALQAHFSRAADPDSLECPKSHSTFADEFRISSVIDPYTINTQIQLENTRWTVVSIFNTGIAPQSAESEIYISLTPGGKAMHGFAGCNRVLGHYEAEGQNLRFIRVSTTKKKCAEGMEQERALLEALQMTIQWKIEHEYLELYSANGQLLARFKRKTIS